MLTADCRTHRCTLGSLPVLLIATDRGATKEFRSLKATFFVGIELRKCKSKYVLGKIDLLVHFLSSN